MLSESEASELFGDYIDEDSQTVQHVRLEPHACDECTTYVAALQTSASVLFNMCMYRGCVIYAQCLLAATPKFESWLHSPAPTAAS